MATNRVWRLTQRPDGEITDGVLSLEDSSIPEPVDGQFLLRLNYLSLDPTNRGWMNPEPTYLPPVALGDPMRGIVCGTVTESRHPDFATGDIVSGIGQWAEYQIGTPETLNKLDPGPLPLADAFGLFAVVGPTAYLPEAYPAVKALLFFHARRDQTITYQAVDWSISGDPALVRTIATALDAWDVPGSP